MRRSSPAFPVSPTHRLLPLLSLLAATGAAAAPKAAPASKSTPFPKPQIPVKAWIGPPTEQTNIQRFRELAACGFTMNFSIYPNAGAVQRALDVGKATGVKVFVYCPELESDTERTVRRFMNHPALAGYHLKDEPPVSDFPRLAAWAKRVQKVDKKHGIYINLMPNHATVEQMGVPTYREYVNRFLAAVPVPYLSWDQYPVVGNITRPEYYENLEICAAAAARKRIPMWAFSLAVAHGPYPIATVPHMRYQVFSNLAYGVQGIQFFTYWVPPKDPKWNFHQAPIERDGKRTVVYNRVKQVTSEIRGLSPVFLGAKVVNVGHTGKLPKGTRRYTARKPITGVTTKGDGAVVSLLQNGSKRYLAIVNRDINRQLPLTVSLDGSKRVFEVDKQSRERPVRGKSWQRTLAPGDLALLSWRG